MIQIHDLQVVKPEFMVEYAEGRFNWTALIDRLAAPDPLPSGDETLFRIDRIRLIEPAVTFRSSLIPGGKTTLHLRNLEITNIGSTPEAATSIQAVFQAVLQLLGQKSAEDEGGVLPPELRHPFRKTVKDRRTRPHP